MNLPDFSFEKKIAKKGYKVIAGVDEVGRGSFAGPVVAGCVVFKLKKTSGSCRSPAPGPFRRLTSTGPLPWGPPARVTHSIVINDSKKLTPKAREIASFWIKRNALCYGIGWASVSQINRYGIKKASEIAFRRAIKNCNKRIDYLLIDAFYVPYVRGLRRKNQKPIIKGDSKSFSIAAASIIAKVYRDKLMTRLGDKPKYQKYGWDKNKGYGTASHLKAITKYGSTRIHRTQFVRTWRSNPK